MEIKAIKVTQPLGEFYIAKIKAGDLLNISTSSVMRYDDKGNLKGNQRKLDERRLILIANFIMSEEMSFPTSILVAANIDSNNGNVIEDPNKRWNAIPTEGDPDIYTISIPKGISSIIIDGQHRLNAFNYANKSCKDIELICSIFFDLPNPYQAYLFATINGNQKRVDKSLALEMFGYDVENKPRETWSPEKLAVYLTRKFNFTKESPLYQKIKLAPLYNEISDRVDKSQWLLSTAAMVEGITSLISTNPQKDRDFLTMKKSFWGGNRTRKELLNINDKPVLRRLYTENKDEELYDIIFKYFSSVSTILWNNAIEGSVIVKTIGISVLFIILKTILEKEGEQENYDKLVSKMANIDFTNDYFSLSGSGKSRLARVLKYKLGYFDVNDLKEDDRQFLKL